MENTGKKYNDMLIRNFDASYLYWQIKDDALISEYLDAKKQLKETDTPELKQKVESLHNQIWSFNKDITLPKKDTRYLYSGTITDSLMSRHLRELVKDSSDAIRTVSGVDYTDVIINIKFKSDVYIKTDENKNIYNKDTGLVEQLDEKKSKRLITKTELRKMAYANGVTINGRHYVNFQRTSSKARTGNCLFIDEKYFAEMESWQTLAIPFREKFAKDEKIDIVSTRSYESLTSSSIIGTLDIDPNSILLIDEADGTHTMPCNVVTLDAATKRLKVTEQDYEKHIDLWDGQSLADESIFNTGKYIDRNGDEHTYKDKGFLLLRNHFFKSAIFNTKLQEYYHEKFAGVDDPVIYDRFGNAFKPYDVRIVTTKNSVKILKFADVIVEHMVSEDKKDRLRELEANSRLQELKEKCIRINNRATAAKRKHTILSNKGASSEEIAEAKLEEQKAISDQENLLPELEKEIKKLEKPIKFEKERLTWDWYREKLVEDKQLFGVCKYEKTSKFGDRQQLWYQVLDTLNLDEEQLWKIVEPQVHEINLMKKYPAFLKHGLNTKASDTDNIGTRMMKELLQINENITRTTLYTNYRRTFLNSILDRLYQGKIQLNNSDFCTLVGNPYEMLRASTGEKIETSILSDFQCYCKRYADGEELYGFRSPHIAVGENAILKNTYRDEWKWFNFSDRILVINLWGKGCFLTDIWGGSDQDSDVSYIGNDPIILETTKETVNSGKYLIPINGLSPENDPKNYTNEEMASIDGKLANDFIGKICNLARDLQCFYWHLYNTGTEQNKEKYLSQIYDDICILASASNIAIDSAKRRYKGVNLATEISEIRKRPYLQAEGAVLRDDGTLLITEQRYKKTVEESTISEYKELVQRRNEATTEAEIQELTEEIDNLFLKVNPDQYMVRPQFTKGLKSTPKKKKKHFTDEKEKELHRQKQILLAQERKALEEKIYIPLECTMDKLATVIKEHLERAERTKMITFVDILNPIPKGTKADYNRIEAIKKIGLEWNNRLNQVYAKYASGDITAEEMFELKQNLIQNALNEIRYSDVNQTIERKITTWDIQKLIRDIFDVHPRKDKHGKVVKDEKGKIVLDDKRDKRLIGDKKKHCLGQTLLQWIYEVYPKEFLAAIKSNPGTVTYLEEVTENVTSSKTSVKSLKDLNQLITRDEIYELYGKKYQIKTKVVQ